MTMKGETSFARLGGVLFVPVSSLAQDNEALAAVCREPVQAGDFVLCQMWDQYQYLQAAEEGSRYSVFVRAKEGSGLILYGLEFFEPSTQEASADSLTTWVYYYADHVFDEDCSDFCRGLIASGQIGQNDAEGREGFGIFKPATAFLDDYEIIGRVLGVLKFVPTF